MSGSPMGNNVVPLPTASPASPYWPMPQMMPVCCPPGGMDALMKCYCDIQSATAFICAVMVDCINTNPAVTQAIIDAIAKSGSNVPLLGVTNGSAAQPGQVGEIVAFNQSQTVTVPTGGTGGSFLFNMGVLQPGSWYLTAAMFPSFGTMNANYGLTPVPNGFSTGLIGGLASTTTEESYIISQPAKADISVPTLLAMTVNLVVTGGATGSVDMQVVALRVR